MRLKVSIGEESHVFDQRKMLNTEAMAIERVTGGTTTEWQEMLARGSVLAMTALVWVIRKRKEPNLQFAKVEFSASDVDMTPVCDEGHELPILVDDDGKPTGLDDCRECPKEGHPTGAGEAPGSN
jgi:hypothetical protein